MTDYGDIIVDSAVLTVGGVQLTISRGGWAFDPGEEWDDFMYPGRTMNTKGARELARLQPKLKGTVMMTGEAQVSAYRPDGAWSGSILTGTRIFRPNALRGFLTRTDYLENVVCVWKRQRGDYFAVEFPLAICSGWSLGSTDGDEGLIPLTIEAVQDLTDATTKTGIPYRMHTLPAVTQLADLA